MSDPWRRLLATAARALGAHPYWGSALQWSPTERRGLHVAILPRDELDRALFGVDRILRRTSAGGVPPFGAIGRRDVVLLKRAGGGVAGLAEASRVWSFVDLTPDDAARLVSALPTAGAPPATAQELTSRCVTVVRLDRITTIPFGLTYEKSDPRKWIVLCSPTHPAAARRFVNPASLRGMSAWRRRREHMGVVE